MILSSFSQALSSLQSLVSDLRRFPPAQSPEIHPLPALIRPLLLSLPDIESRHRTRLSPLLSALASCNPAGVSAEVQEAVTEEAIELSGVKRDELDVMKVGVELRVGSRSLSEGEGIISLKRLTEDLERREYVIVHAGCSNANKLTER